MSNSDIPLCILDPSDPQQAFPNVETALRDPDGLLALGGDLSVSRLLNAYRHGIFPWYDHDSPIMWWSPDPRMLIDVAEFKPQRSLRKIIKRGDFQFSYDQAFPEVIRACAAPRPNSQGTWLVEEMIAAYIELHLSGHAHSFEAWHNHQLVGGFYGVGIGQVFFGESMFSRASNASKACLTEFIHYAKQWHYQLVDCQVYSHHLASLGANCIPRTTFISLLERYCALPTHPQAWQDCQKPHLSR